MIPCKTAKANLENCTRLFLLIGLVAAMVIVLVSLEWKSKPTTRDFDQNAVYSQTLQEENIPEANQIEEIPKQISETPPNVVLDNFKVVADDKKIKEYIILSTETDEKEAIVIQKIDYKQVKEEIIEEEVVEDIPFFVIEDVPIFPGCTGIKEALKKCMQENIQKFVFENFNTEIAQEIGLDPGVKRIFVTFIIDKNGRITQIESRAPHKILQTEAERVIKSLPKMEPGKQRGKPVRVKYSLPIVFQVL